MGQLKEKKDDDGSFLGLELTDFDPTGISGTVEGCSETGTEAQDIKCAKSVLDMISIADPTGLTAMASSFMHPTCDV